MPSLVRVETVRGFARGSTDLALRPRCQMVGRVQRGRAGDRRTSGGSSSATVSPRSTSPAERGGCCCRICDAGLDVDGCDVSEDMIALCRERAEREGLSPTLFVQPMHELDPPRSYRTIVVCGGFALGSDRAQDLQALARFYEHLEPGGTLVLDNEVPTPTPRQWRHWLREERTDLPRAWSDDDGERRRASDGTELALQSRLLALDPFEQRATLEIRARQWRDGELVAEEDPHAGHRSLLHERARADARACRLRGRGGPRRPRRAAGDGGRRLRRLRRAQAVVGSLTRRMWWRDAVLYQIYVRSFADANGDGHGDLPGIRSKLDYLEWLGVDAIWLTPIHPSPNADWGYDVSDFHGVHPDYGTLDDLDALVADAGARGMKIVLDLVPNHTSSEHPWFSDPAKRDWYVWADEPNNWTSTFGGSAWTKHPEVGRYYLHNFLPEQPDLNWWNDGVRDEFEETLRFWFDRGIAGFRIDVAHALVKDAELRDNPSVGKGEGPARGARLQHEPTGGARDLPPLARDRARVRPRAGAPRRDVGSEPRGAREVLRRRRRAPAADDLLVHARAPRSGGAARDRGGNGAGVSRRTRGPSGAARTTTSSASRRAGAKATRRRSAAR